MYEGTGDLYICIEYLLLDERIEIHKPVQKGLETDTK